MIAVSSRDFIYSISLHLGLILIISLLNPFTVKIPTNFDSVAVNLISLPPLGDPALIEENMPEISIPRAQIEDEVSIPISSPESKTETYEIKKKQEPPKRDTGYKGLAQTGDSTQKGGTDVSDQIGPGSQFGAVSIDNASFNYPYYFVQTFGKIQRHWSNPVAANQPLSCVIYFQIIRSGTVLDPVIEKSSGVPTFDRACLRAILTSSPLPPLPTDFKDDIIGIHLEFPYQPR